MEEIRAACADDAEMSLIVELLYQMAARIQDVAQLHWNAITAVYGGEHAGKALVLLKKLKSTSRQVYIRADTFQKLTDYKVNVRKIRKNAWPDTQVFETPSDNALTMRVIKFFKAKGIRV